MFKSSILLLSTLLVLFFAGCSSDEDSDAQEVNAMLSLNEYILTGLDSKQYVVTKKGTGFVLEGAKGKVVIFDIFATWCPPCKAAAVHLSSLQEKYKDDLIIIGITIEDNIQNQKLLDFRKQYTANYTLVNSTENRRMTNAIAAVLKLGNRYPIPTMALYKDGVLINHFIGAVQEEFIESDIKKALGK